MTYYRIFMRGIEDEDANIVVHVPLTDDGSYDSGERKPHLLRAIANQQTYYGELMLVDGVAVMEWDAGGAAYPSPTDLFKAPVRNGRIVKVDSFYNENDGARFKILDLAKL
jgi:hypothetical protein